MLVQPTTTAIVYLLGVVAIGAGLHFLHSRNGQRARLWWGIALLLWGAGALAAGTSYEAFSYQIKCVGRRTCAWTSWWEIWYLVLTMAIVDAIVMAQAYSGTHGTWRRVIAGYAAAHCALYTLMVLVGAAIPARFLISFEMLLVASVPSAVLCVVLNASRYRTMKRDLDIALLRAWAWMALTIGAYYLYLVSGWTQRLWARGAWFSENDVLHIGLIAWMVYVVRVVSRHVVDETESRH